MNKIILITGLVFISLVVLVQAGNYIWPSFYDHVFFETDTTWFLNDKLTLNGTLNINGSLEILEGNTISSLGNKLAIGIQNPTSEVHVIGDINITGTIYYGTLQGNSPQSFISRDSNNNFQPTKICMISTNDTLVLASIGIDRGDFVWTFEQDSAECLDKELLEVNETDNTITTTRLFKKYDRR